MVDPLVEEVVDGQGSDLRMIPAAGQVGSRQCLHDGNAGGAALDEFRQLLGWVAQLILAFVGDSGRVPGREPGPLLSEDRADTASEATLFRLDQVTDHLQHTPLPGCGTPSQERSQSRRELRPQDDGQHPEQRRGVSGARVVSVIMHPFVFSVGRGFSVSEAYEPEQATTCQTKFVATCWQVDNVLVLLARKITVEGMEGQGE